MTEAFIARPLVAGRADGEAMLLGESLSFWGGVDVETGHIVGRHRRAGDSVSGRVLVMPSGRGSSSSSSVLAELIRSGNGPAAILLAEVDEIIALGALVAQELYGLTCPVVECVILPGDLVEGEGLVVNEDGSVERATA